MKKFDILIDDEICKNTFFLGFIVPPPPPTTEAMNLDEVLKMLREFAGYSQTCPFWRRLQQDGK